MTEPEQPALVEPEESDAAKPVAKGKRKRASVPSWDEIMFGSPEEPLKRRSAERQRARG